MKLSEAKERDTNQLIFDIVEYQKDSDIDELYSRLKQLELYSPIVSANFDWKEGERVTIQEGMELAISSGEVHGFNVAVFFINKNDKRLGSRFVGMSVAESFDMVERTNYWEGILFYNDKDSYFGIVRQDFAGIKSQYLQE